MGLAHDTLNGSEKWSPIPCLRAVSIDQWSQSNVLRAAVSEHRFQSCGLRAAASEHRPQSSGLRAPASEQRSQSSGSRAVASEQRSQSSSAGTLESAPGKGVGLASCFCKQDPVPHTSVPVPSARSRTQQPCASFARRDAPSGGREPGTIAAVGAPPRSRPLGGARELRQRSPAASSEFASVLRRFSCGFCCISKQV